MSDKPRVFVSSVMEGFSDMRGAARAGIEAASSTPVMAEDFGSLAASPRSACLDAVASADALIAVVGGRGGWVAPSGKLVVEEEIEEALKRKKPIFVFLQEVSRDDGALRLAVSLSDYVHGRFRSTFATIEELRAKVSEAVASLPRTRFRSLGDMSGNLQKCLQKPHAFPQHASLRLAFISTRDESLVDPIDFESAQFQKVIYELGHAGDEPLFSYQAAKKHNVGADTFLVTQSPAFGGNANHVRFELRADGATILDISVTSADHSSAFAIVEDDLTNACRSAFSFCSRFFARIDPHQRHAQFVYGAAIHDEGHRTLIPDRNPRSSYSIRMFGESTIGAFAEPRLISRRDIETPGDEINAVLTMLRRRMNKQG